MNIFARYYWNENLYISAAAPTEDMTDNLHVGAGYSFNVLVHSMLNQITRYLLMKMQMVTEKVLLI